VRLPESLRRYLLVEPPTGDTLIAAIRASLCLLELGPPDLGFVLLPAVYRSVMGSTDFGVYVAGPSGAFKTEVAALAQQHFGRGLTSRNVPGSWSSTDNSLETAAFLLKDALMVADDFAPAGSIADRQRMNAKADRVLRGQGNNSG
jgi:hypothetical protein